MVRTSDGRYLKGVQRLRMTTEVGPEDGFPNEFIKRKVTERNFQPEINCPGNCRGGGFELGDRLRGIAIQARREKARGTIRCRGFNPRSAGGRKPCAYVLRYDAEITYSPY